MKAIAGGALAACLFAACSGVAPGMASPGARTTGGAPEMTPTPTILADDKAAPATQEPFEQTFGPAFAPAPAPGRPTWISSAELGGDRLTLTITFVGGQAYLASNPCSTDYEPWLGAHGDELDVEVVNVQRPDQARLGPNMGCTQEGYGHTYHLRLPQPFLGTTVNDLAQGGTLYVGTPAGVLVATKPPPGWSLQRSFQEEPGPPPIWVEIYAAAPVGNEWEGAGQLVLYQAFGIVGEWSDTRAIKSQDRGGHAVTVALNGAAATVWVDAASGELLLAWTQNGRSLGLIGNAADMTPQELVTIAEGVAAAPG